MGNSSGKESRPAHPPRGSRPPSRNDNSPTSSGPTGPAPHASADRLTPTSHATRSRHSSRPDLSFLGIGSRDDPPPVTEVRRETKAEREARKLAKERETRAKERDRSMKEEGVDGGYLVTLGVYTGTEDFSKPVVRQLMLERKIAPFWRGLDDHSDSWVEHQLIAVAKGLPLPPPDEIPPESPECSEASPRGSSTNINHLTVPISGRSASTQSDRSMNLSPSHPAFSLPPPTSPLGQSPSSNSPFFRGRAKTLAALSTSTKLNSSQTDLTPQEVHLPRDPYVNGLRLEAFLYRDPLECPICFMYYPPYLNKTRCCDQPICSECFVQIKRPDPHAPEHHDDPNNPDPAPPPPDDATNLVSEPSACPYCNLPEFGVTYEPPPFRRGLAYAGTNGNSLTSAASAMSSTSSLHSGLTSPVANRRRATSLSASAPGVITTDRVRPDWAKKLSDARTHAMRRAAAATALHNAAYVLGNQGGESSRQGLGRRRRNMFGGDSPGGSGRGTPRDGDGTSVSTGGTGGRSRESQRTGEVGPDGQPIRITSSRRVEDLEELMMMEAIRLSLVAEEERKRKEEKEASKEAKKEEKKKAKEAKKNAKEAKKSNAFGSSSAMASRSSLLNNGGKGKEKEVDRMDGPSSGHQASSSTDAQQHLETSRARLEEQTPDSPFGASVFNALGDSSHRALLREVSNNSSSASSVAEESNAASLLTTDTTRPGLSTSSTYSGGLGIPSVSQDDSDMSSQPTPSGNPSTEPMLNFRSLTAAITASEDKNDEATSSGTAHIERIPEHPEDDEHSKAEGQAANLNLGGGGGDLDNEASPSSNMPEKSEERALANDNIRSTKDQDEIAPVVQSVDADQSSSYDSKHIGDVSIMDGNNSHHSITQ